MRLHQPDQAAGLQHAQPGFGGVDRHPGISGQRRQVDQLANPSRAQRDEALKRSEIADFQYLAHIAFDIATKRISTNQTSLLTPR